MSEHVGSAPAGRRSPLGDADRERLVALLREHYAAGWLDLDDLRHLVGVVLAAANAEQAAVALADLSPAGFPDTPSTGRRRGSRGRHAQTSEPEPGWVRTRDMLGARPLAPGPRRWPTRPQVMATRSGLQWGEQTPGDRPALQRR
jgi:hypothetical protein